MGFWDFIKDNKIDVNGIIGNVSSGIDMLAFTAEERAQFNVMLADKLAAYVGSTLTESSTRSKTRRVISYIVIGFFVLLVTTYVIALFVNPEVAEEMKPLVSSGVMVTAFIMVLAFFFGGYYSEKLDLFKKSKK